MKTAVVTGQSRVVIVTHFDVLVSVIAHFLAKHHTTPHNKEQRQHDGKTCNIMQQHSYKHHYDSYGKHKSSITFYSNYLC